MATTPSSAQHEPIEAGVPSDYSYLYGEVGVCFCFAGPPSIEPLLRYSFAWYR